MKGWLSDRLAHWRAEQEALNDPAQWMANRLGVHVWSKQREIISALKPGAKVAVQSSNGTGKTYLAAALALHHVTRHRGTDSGVCIVGPSWGQLEAGTLEHVRDYVGSGQLPGKMVHKVYREGHAGRIIWKSPPEGPESRHLLQGIHWGGHTLVILEEASEISRILWAEANGAIQTGGRSCTTLAIGNPVTTGTAYHEVCTDPSRGWQVVQIGTLDTPNFTGEEVPEHVADALPRRGWMEEQRRELTEAEFKARVMGEFPEESELALFDREWIARAQEYESEPPADAPVVFGFDPAAGGDRSVCMMRVGERVRRVPLGVLEKSRDREAVAKGVAKAARERNAKVVVVDSFHVGAEHATVLASLGINVLPINSGDVQKLRQSKRRVFLNPRSLWAWQMREDLQTGGLDIDPADKALATQMRELRQRPMVNGKLALEHKADMTERLGRSPDDLDALMLTYHAAQSLQVVGRAGVVGFS